MIKPSKFDETQAQREFIPVELGGHILVIKEVLEMQSRTGRDMLRISFDFADSDRQPKHFEKLFRDDIRPDKKWPFGGTTYLLTEDNEGSCSRQFKTFTTSVEKSNPGFAINWGDKFAGCFKNKLVGGVFGIVEEEYDGKRTMKRPLRWFRSVDGVLEADIPEEKLLAPSTNNYVPAPNSDGFLNIPDGIDEELPFN